MPAIANSQTRKTGNTLDQVVLVDAARLGGEPVFRGTRVPIKALFEYLEAGDSLDVFLDEFAGVTREQARAVIELAARGLLDGLARP